MMSWLFPLFVLAALAQDATPSYERIWDTKNRTWLEFSDLATRIEPGTIVVLGEVHAFPGDEQDIANLQHHANQYRFLQELSRRAQLEQRKIHVGMEFLFYNLQEAADRWLADLIDDEEFVNQSGWGSSPLFFYRNQMREPTVTGGRLIALNTPRAVSYSVAKNGPEGLSPEHRQLLPPIWERGRPEYYERVETELKDHGPGINIENYFMAQSLWDDTMAWNATKSALGLDNLVIIVGEGHVIYGHGLPSRLNRYGAEKIITIVQRSISNWNDRMLEQVIAPHSRYGEASDLIWVYSNQTR